MRRVPPSLWLVALGCYAFLYAPILVVMVYSFNAAKRGGPWAGFTLEWYGKLLSNPERIGAAWKTVILAVTSTAVSTVIGTLLGYGLSRYRFAGKRLCSLVLYIPVVIPDVVMAVAMLMFYGLVRAWLGIFELGLSTMIVAHITFQIPFVSMIVRSRLAGLDPAIEEAAHDLGANAWQKFWHVLLPLMRPGIVAGAALAFTLSIDDFVVSFFTTGPGATTLPILIYTSVKRGITPDINALSTLIVLISVAGTVIVGLFQRRVKASTGGARA